LYQKRDEKQKRGLQVGGSPIKKILAKILIDLLTISRELKREEHTKEEGREFVHVRVNKTNTSG